MDLFSGFKGALKRTLRVVRAQQDDVSAELVRLIESSDNWEGLETKLLEVRTRSRKRQQEILERLEPLAKRVERLLAEAKTAKIKVVKQNLLRQADSYMRELECEDEAAKIHSSNCSLITDLLKQVRRARAMGERGVDAEAIDSITAYLEEIADGHAAAFDAADELDSVSAPATGNDVAAGDVARRLSSVYENGEEEPQTDRTEQDMEQLQNRLFAETA